METQQLIKTIKGTFRNFHQWMESEGLNPDIERVTKEDQLKYGELFYAWKKYCEGGSYPDVSKYK